MGLHRSARAALVALVLIVASASPVAARPGFTVLVSARPSSMACDGFSTAVKVTWRHGATDFVQAYLATSGGISLDVDAIDADPDRPRGSHTFTLSSSRIPTGSQVVAYAVAWRDGVPLEPRPEVALGQCTGVNGPDLRVSLVQTDFQGSSTWGYDVTIANIGTLPASLANVRIEGVWSTDTGFSPPGDPTACGITLPRTEPSLIEGQTRVFHIDCASGPDGHTWLLAKVDTEGIVAELDETNNLGATRVGD